MRQLLKKLPNSFPGLDHLGPEGRERSHHHKSTLLTDCFYESRGEYNNVAFLDIGEVLSDMNCIFPQNKNIQYVPHTFPAHTPPSPRKLEGNGV